MRKKRILVVSESHALASGFGTYAKEVLSRLHASGKYELAEFACYGNPHQFENTDWLVYGNAPMKHEEQYIKEHEQPIVQWGITRFEIVCLDFKPDIVFMYRDPWMDSYILDSPFRPFFHLVWMPTIDSEPQKTEWLYLFEKCDALFAYSEYGIRTLKEQTKGRIVPVGCASPAINYDQFDIKADKNKHKATFGVPTDSFVVGTVMRNQKRKMFADLMRGFKTFIDSAPKHIAQKSFLYLHTSYPEKHGWNLTSLIHEFELGSKVLCTYICRACKKHFAAHYRDAVTVCDHCKATAAVLPGVGFGLDHKNLSDIYNLFDLYVQYAICEGFGIPLIEAAACGVPTCGINYSAMEDTLRFTRGIPISPSLNRELETGADRSGPNEIALAQALNIAANTNNAEYNRKRVATRKACQERYNWDQTAQNLCDYFDQVEPTELQGQWNHPPLFSPVPDKPVEGLNNYAFAEWVCTNVIQDQSALYNHKMLSIVKGLNFGASDELGPLGPYNQKSAYEQNATIGRRRHLYDAIRVGHMELRPQEFLAEAHKRIKQ